MKSDETLRSVSRRDFLRKGSTGVATALFAPGILSCAGMGSRENKKLGIALVGIGYYSRSVLAPCLQHTQYARLAGIVTGSAADDRDFIEKYSIEEKNIYSYADFDRVADNPDIDIIYVVLPNGMHREYTIRAARAGKHVICEKPMAANAQECRDMIAACKKAGVQLSIGYRMHFEPYTQEIMRLSRDKDFGEIRLVSAGAGYRHTDYDHWKTKKELAGGAMMDMGVYSLQAARYSTGEEPVSVSAQTFKTRPEHFEADEITTFQLQFPSGTVASCETGFHASFNYLKVYCEKGWYELEPFSAYNGIKGRSSAGEFQFPDINQQVAQMDEVALCIQEGRPMRVPGEEGLKDMIIVDAVYESIASGGSTISIPEFRG